jgi:general secretion pathway protein G
MNPHWTKSLARAVTPIELVLAILVLGVLAVMVCPKVFDRTPYAGPTAAVGQMAAFKTALEAYRQDTGDFPKGTNGLFDLVQQPPGVTNWHGPYLDKVPQDPWGRDYLYDCPGKHTASGYPFAIICLGPPGKDSPIASWSYPGVHP